MVVLPVSRGENRLGVWIDDPFGESTEQLQEPADLRLVEVPPKFRPRHSRLRLCEAAFRYNELELTLEPLTEQTRRRSRTRKQP
jgi:hypothetical protein